MQRVKEYDATVELGLPVTLIDTVTESEDGSKTFPKVRMMLATIAVARALTPVQLVGAELRFLRGALLFTGAEFAEAIGISDKRTVLRWENDRTRPRSFTEKIVRQLVLNLLAPHAPGVEIPANAIPGMKISPRQTSEGPLPMTFELARRDGADGEAADCYASAA